MRQLTLSAILQPERAGMLGTVSATEDLPIRLDAVADDAAMAMRTLGGKRVNSALE